MRMQTRLILLANNCNRSGSRGFDANLNGGRHASVLNDDINDEGESMSASDSWVTRNWLSNNTIFTYSFSQNNKKIQSVKSSFGYGEL